MPNRHTGPPNRHWRRMIGPGQDVRGETRRPRRARRGGSDPLLGEDREHLSAAIVGPERSGGGRADGGRVKPQAARRQT